MKKFFLVMMSVSTVVLFGDCNNPCTNVPRVNLGVFPTKIKKLATLGAHLHVPELYIKCDNACGAVTATGKYFGGNKIRKLEFLLADALKQNKKSVITIGCAGSNHVVATGSSCAQYGLRCHAVIRDQPNSYVVKRNLKLMHHYGIVLHPVASAQERDALFNTFRDQETDELPYQIPVGGSCPIGVLGFVNAAFELKEQIDAGQLPEPDYIFVPTGSCGTAAGLILGLQLANVKAKVIAVAIEPDENNFFKTRIKELYDATAELLQCPAPLSQEDIVVDYAHGGKEYGYWTDEACAAIDLLQATENITLDGTYSAKAFAALLQYADQGLLHNKTVVFWNTFCSDEYADVTDAVNYHDLPLELQKYFS